MSGPWLDTWTHSFSLERDGSDESYEISFLSGRDRHQQKRLMRVKQRWKVKICAVLRAFLNALQGFEKGISLKCISEPVNNLYNMIMKRDSQAKSLVCLTDFSGWFHLGLYLLCSGIPEHCHGSNISKGKAKKPTEVVQVSPQSHLQTNSQCCLHCNAFWVMHRMVSPALATSGGTAV